MVIELNNSNFSRNAEPTLSRLVAQRAVTDLIHAYALNIRRANGPACVELFAADSVFEIRDAPLDGAGPTGVRALLEGRDAILGYLRHVEASGASVCPMIQNIRVEVNGDRATANSLMTTTVWPDGKRIIGEYDDQFIFDGLWRFSVQTFSILGEFPA